MLLLLWKFNPKPEEDRTLEEFKFNDRLSVKDDDIIIHFLSTYFLSKEDIALSKFPNLLKFLSLCKVEMNKNYLNNKAATDFLYSIATKIQDDLMLEICSSNYVGLMIDESTDVTSTKYLTINLKYLHKNEVKEKFCGLFQIHNSDANGIFSVLLDFLNQYNLLHKVCALSTDGAAVMLSEDNGVAGKLLSYTKNKNMLINHCLSHRLNLGAKDLWKHDVSLNGFNSTIHCICTYFSSSSKRIKILDEEQEILFEAHLKLLKPIDIRWLSIYNVIARIFEIYPAIIKALELIVKSESCVVAEGLLSRMRSVHFVSLLHIFKDLIIYLQPLNDLFQKQELILSEAFHEIDMTLETLQELVDSDSQGNYFEKFCSDNNDVENVKFHNIELSNLYGVRINNMKNKSKELQKILLSHLKSRFPCQKELKLFTIFDIKKISQIETETERRSYGNENLESLINKYNLNKAEVLVEWEKLKVHVRNHFSTSKEIWHFALSSVSFQNIRLLFQIYLVIPLSTAGCERTFSKLNNIKTDLRNRMESTTLQAHMMLSCNGPDLDNIEQLDIQNTIDNWRDIKDRRFSFKKK